jgi:hypothetical protein
VAESDDFDKRDRSPNFPYIGLTEALERCRQLYNASKGSFVRLGDAASDWGLSATSSTPRRVAAALLTYGLIVDEGSGDSRRIRLTPDAIKILTDTRPGVRSGLLSSSAAKPSIINEVFGEWGGARPSDSHAISYLVHERQFTERAAKTFLTVFDDTVSYLQSTDGGQSSAQKDNSLPQDSSEEPTNGNPKQKPPDTSNLPASHTEQEWLRVRVAKDATVRLMSNRDLDRQMVERLIRFLETQKDMMDEDF